MYFSKNFTVYCTCYPTAGTIRPRPPPGPNAPTGGRRGLCSPPVRATTLLSHT